MKILYILFILIGVYGCSKPIKSKQYTYTPISFDNLWEEIISDKYDKLPQNTTSYTKLTKNNQIQKDAKRTLENRDDILKPFDKLAHPNGICFKGIWSIDTPNIYGGYFKQNSKALIIARASTTMNETTSDGIRGFGFAGKIFPTLDKKKINKTPTANFFLIDDLGGTNAKLYSDVNLSNEPNISFNLDILKNLFYAIKITSVFKNSDKHPNIRQLYEISFLGENNTTNIITPKYMKIVPAKTNKIQNKKDFRDELTITNTSLIFYIYVANRKQDGKKLWKKIGKIILDSSVVSYSCDHRLHFHHPKIRD